MALTIEGKFAGEGLQTDDMLSAMARELVEKNGLGENADAIWRALHLQHQRLFPRGKREHEIEKSDGLDDERAAPSSLIDSAMHAEPVLIFGQSSESLKTGRRRSRPTLPEQPSLFG